jgi:hypothetical protein
MLINRFYFEPGRQSRREQGAPAGGDTAPPSPSQSMSAIKDIKDAKDNKDG